MKLTPAEEQLMQYVWNKDKSLLKDLIESYDEPKPAKTTVATTIKKLIDKKFVAYDEIGSTRLYYAIVKKENYFSKQMKNMIHQFFDNSTSNFASFFAKEASLTKEELQNLRDLIDDELKNK
ncbi:BlaI/MecI/CopY family transcriptional regulator [Flavobacterium sp. I3-2]|uniref:BlaI/MecI/CopY family transcriptional regulator n=1 Tax=Flavobacterium sp. I3-2 TaxID=2748319 RepID=UPI0015B04D08|nr:BlaI/MecI/CopY family transcriptional regulator [Flavobacterium sp. I3-2]